MSRIVKSRNIKASHWRYPALVMSESLEKIINKGTMQKEDIPRSVYMDIKEFFDMVAKAKSNAKSKNPMACIANYRIAANALRISSPALAKDRKELDKQLHEYALIINKLGTSFTPSPSELNTLNNLKEFFKQLFDIGDVESYESILSPSIVVKQ